MMEEQTQEEQQEIRGHTRSKTCIMNPRSWTFFQVSPDSHGIHHL